MRLRAAFIVEREAPPAASAVAATRRRVVLRLSLREKSRAGIDRSRGVSVTLQLGLCQAGSPGVCGERRGLALYSRLPGTTKRQV